MNLPPLPKQPPERPSGLREEQWLLLVVDEFLTVPVGVEHPGNAHVTQTPTLLGGSGHDVRCGGGLREGERKRTSRAL